MQFLVDQNVYCMTIEWLRKEGHDVVTVKQIGMERASDEELLKEAKDRGWLLVTRAKGFGALAFLKCEESPGVILLRGGSAVLDAVHHEFKRLFMEHKEELERLFCVVEPHRHRIRFCKKRFLGGPKNNQLVNATSCN